MDHWTRLRPSWWFVRMKIKPYSWGKFVILSSIGYCSHQLSLCAGLWISGRAEENKYQLYLQSHGISSSLMTNNILPVFASQKSRHFLEWLCSALQRTALQMIYWHLFQSILNHPKWCKKFQLIQKLDNKVYKRNPNISNIIYKPFWTVGDDSRPEKWW